MSMELDFDVERGKRIPLLVDEDGDRVVARFDGHRGCLRGALTACSEKENEAAARAVLTEHEARVRLERAAEALLDVLNCTVNGTCVDCRRYVGAGEQHDVDCSVWRLYCATQYVS